MNIIKRTLWKTGIWDGRLPGTCKLFACCLSCPCSCDWRKVHLKEFLTHYKRQYTIDEVNKDLLYMDNTDSNLNRKYKIGDFVVFVNPDRQKSNEALPIDFGYIVADKNNTGSFIIRVADRNSKYWQGLYTVHQDNIAMATQQDDKTNFEIY